MMKRWVRCLCVILLMAVVVGITVAAASEPQAQAANGLVLEDMTIVIPVRATSVERSAANELQAYLQKITGKTVTITRENGSVASAIYIGSTNFAAANNVTYTDKSGYGEGWAIKTIGNNVVLTGGKVRGSLYAVYHLLEDVLGVRWWNMWEEHVPTMTDAIIPSDYDVKGEPAFKLRDIYLNAEETKHLFLARNRCNGFTTNASKAYGGEEAYGRLAHAHTFERYFPPFGSDENFANHPEWYSWSDDKQARISYGQLCLTNEELIREFTAKVLDIIYGDFRDHDYAGLARPRFFSIDPNDMGGFCECDDCEADIAKRGLSGYLIHFVNLIAEEVEKEYPTAILKTSAYAYTLSVPLDDTVPRSNVMLQLADNEEDIIRGLKHPNNAKTLKRIQDWAKICKNQCELDYWDYGVTYRENGIMPNVFRFQSFMQELLANDYCGYFIEMQRCNNTDFWDLKVWVLTKLMENPYLDLETVIMDFLTGYYGEAAADDLYDYLVFMKNKVEPYDQVITFAADILSAQWLTAADVLAGHNYFEKATRELMEDSSITEEQRTYYLKHLHSARGGLDRVILANYDRYCEEMAKQNALFDVDKRAVGTRMLAGLDYLTSMTLSSDHTGYQKVEARTEYDGTGKDMMGSYDHYAARFSPNLGLMEEKPALPAQVLADHPGVNEKHVYDYTANNYWIGDAKFPFVTLEENAASYTGGSAIKVSYADVDSYFNSTGETDKKAAYTITESKGLNGNLPQSLQLGAPLVADGQYHLYRMENVVLYKDSSVVGLFSSDAVNVKIGLLKHTKNKPVDVYLSMKIVGDPTGTDTSNYATYYIDRLIVVENCDESDFVAFSTDPADCPSNGMCRVCGATMRGTKLPHRIEGGYTYNASSKAYEAQCLNCGKVSFPVRGKLPQTVESDLETAGIGLNHVYDYVVGNDAFTIANGVELQDDSASISGKAAVLNTNKDSTYQVSSGKPLKVYRGCHTASSVVLGEITYEQIVGNVGKGYQTYKFEDVPLVRDDFLTIFAWNWGLQAPWSISNDLAKLRDKPVDLYISMKVEEFNKHFYSKYYKYYIDRIIVVDSCDVHISDTDYLPDDDSACGSTATTISAACPVCGKRLVKESGPMTHSFTEYIAATNGATEYVAVCDNGCGAKDVKLDPEYKKDEMLPEGLSEHARRHIIQVYRVKDFRVEVEGRLQWDLDINRPVVQRSYDRTQEATARDSLNMSIAGGISACMYSHQGTLHGFPGIKGEELAENSGKGYVLYENKGVIPIQDPSYYYFFMFGDWGLQIQYLDDDLMLGYRNTPVDIYYHVKVEGNPYCNGGPNPEYYIDQVIVTESCDGGDDCMGKPLTVRFNTNGGSTVAAQKVYYGQKVTQPADPTKDGYIFKGWYYDNQVFDFGTSVTADMTLKAMWEHDEHTVVVDAAVAETCTTTGLTEGSHCSECGETIVKQEEIPALGHSYVAGDWGGYTKSCTICGHYESLYQTNYTGKLDGDFLKMLEAEGIGLEHVYTYSCGSLVPEYDIGSPVQGPAAVYYERLLNSANVIREGAAVKYPNAGVVGYFTDINEKTPNGYQIYKTAENYTLGSYDYFYVDNDRGWIPQFYISEKYDELAGKTLDMYVAMRVKENSYYFGNVMYVAVSEHTGADCGCTVYHPTECAVSFDGNGASGSMESVSVTENGQYQLPACEFTSPDNNSFKGWQVGDFVVPAGDCIAVMSDTTLTPVWYDHAHDWVGATCTAPKTCSICGATEGKPLDHTEETIPAVDPAPGVVGWTEGKKCSVCDKILEAPEEIPALPTEPTFAIGKAVAKSYSLSLEGVVFMNVYFTVEGYTASNAADIQENVGMYVWNKTDYTGDPLTSDLALADKCPATAKVWNSSNSEYRYMAQTEGIAAAKLGDDLIMIPYAEIDGVTYLAEKPVDKSPRVYAESNIPKASTDAAMKNVLISLMNYGAATQQKFGYKTDSLMNDFLDADQKVLGLDSVVYTPRLEVDAAKVDAAMTRSALVTSRTASLSLEGAINVNYYFKYSGTAVDAKLLFWKQETYTADGAVLTEANADLTVDLEQLADGRYYGDYKNIAAAHMGKTLFCCAVFTNAAGETAYSGVISYSPMHYANNNKANADTALATMMQYMAVYGNYANIKWPG